jgi:hypothetical protein
MPTGKCPLCLQEKKLVMSHLMPAAIYRYCRPPGGHHITLTNELMIETDRHLQGYLLGSDCENDLNKGGETWPMPLLASYQGTFPRREIWTFVLMRSRISRWACFGRLASIRGADRRQSRSLTLARTQNLLAGSCAASRNFRTMSR